MIINPIIPQQMNKLRKRKRNIKLEKDQTHNTVASAFCGGLKNEFWVDTTPPLTTLFAVVRFWERAIDWGGQRHVGGLGCLSRDACSRNSSARAFQAVLHACVRGGLLCSSGNGRDLFFFFFGGENVQVENAWVREPSGNMSFNIIQSALITAKLRAFCFVLERTKNKMLPIFW